MFTSNFFYLAIILAIFGLGDIVGHYTKGKFSGLMVVYLVFLVAFMSGALPKDVIAQSGLTAIATHAMGMILFNMGSSINFRQLIQEWRTVAMAALCMVASCLLLYCTAPIIGRTEALATMPIINGAMAAAALMATALNEKGMANIAALCALVWAVQKFVGTPLASIMGQKYARKILAEYRSSPEKFQTSRPKQDALEVTRKIPFFESHKAIFTPYVCLAIAAIGAWLSHILADLTGINFAIWALILGSLSRIGGYLPPKPLQKGQSTGILMVAIFGNIIPSLGQISFSDLGSMLFQTVVIFAAACLGIFLVSYILPTWKLVGDKNLAVGIGAQQFLGFPSNAVICHEVAEIVGETQEEKDFVEDTLSVPYIVGGITVVTILSVTMAGIVISLL